MLSAANPERRQRMIPRGIRTAYPATRSSGAATVEPRDRRTYPAPITTIPAARNNQLMREKRSDSGELLVFFRVVFILHESTRYSDRVNTSAREPVVIGNHSGEYHSARRCLTEFVVVGREIGRRRDPVRRIVRDLLGAKSCQARLVPPPPAPVEHEHQERPGGPEDERI